MPRGADAFVDEEADDDEDRGHRQADAEDGQAGSPGTPTLSTTTRPTSSKPPLPATRNWSRPGQHIRAFTELMNNRQGRHLGQWIDRAQADDLHALHSLVNGLGQDLDAIVAG